jgi:putative nucleotidyltransferase with HDIG domain
MALIKPTEKPSQHLREQHLAEFERLRDLPTLSVIALKVNAMLSDTNVRAKDVVALLRQDQVLTAKILKLVNSSYYSIPGGVQDVQKALMHLGFQTVAQLVLSVSIIGSFKATQSQEGLIFSYPEFWKHCLATALVAEYLAIRMGHPDPAEIFTSALLHDIGKLVYHRVDADRFLEIVLLSKEQGRSMIEIEKEVGGCTHAEFGALLAQRWDFPQKIRTSIEKHHEEISLVSVSDDYVRYKKVGASGNGCEVDLMLLKESVWSLGVKVDHWDDLEVMFESLMDRVEGFLNVSR